MWRQLTFGKQQEIKIKKTLFDISDSLRSYTTMPHINLLSGTSGIALFYSYFGEFQNNYEYNKVAQDIVKNCFSGGGLNFEKEDAHRLYSFGYGISGLTWTLCYLLECGLINFDSVSISKEFDEEIYKNGIANLDHDRFDFIEGFIGIGVYFIERLKSEKNIIAYLNNFIEIIYAKSEMTNEEILVNSCINPFKRFTNDKEEKEYDIGLAHGVPSIIVFLSKVCAILPDNEKCRKLLHFTINWLLKNECSLPNNGLFPHVVGNSSPMISRLAWCYGDLGIASSLWQAGVILNDQAYKNKAIEIILRASKRRNFEETMVKDAGICHGSAGVAHFFNRFYQITNITEFEDASIFWFNETINMARFGDGIGGYKLWSSNKWVNIPGLLEGTAGIGLTLLSAISNIEPKWDRCLLLS